MEKVDLLIRNGHVIDTLQGVDEIKDIGVLDNRIVALDFPSVNATRTVDASGCYVVPGLIDFHTHVYYGGSGFGVNPDYFLAHGVTATVDAGSSGCDNFNAFYRSVIMRSSLRIRSYLNVASSGMYNAKIYEDVNPALFDEKHIRALKMRYGNEILGLKIRVSKEITGNRGLEPLRAAVALAEKIGQLSICVHTTDPTGTTSEIASLLRSGDVYTHCYQGYGETILDPLEKVHSEILKARLRGVIFDECNGSRNNSIDVAKSAIAQGFLPDVISTDLSTVTLGVSNRCRNLPFVMSRYLALGLNLKQIVAKVTEIPAKLMGMEGEIGTLREGAFADIAILSLEQRKVVFDDALGSVLEGEQTLVPQMTIRDGELAFCQTFFCNKI